jgi:hypothetical protein
MLQIDFTTMSESIYNIPLRVKKSLAAGFIADAEFKQADTNDLIQLARVRKHIYTTDRASAIAALKGVI